VTQPQPQQKKTMNEKERQEQAAIQEQQGQPETCKLRPEDAGVGHLEFLPGQIPQPGHAMSKEDIEKMMAQQDAIKKEASIPRWDEYRGDHHNSIPDPGIMQGGSVSFTRHIGKPLSKELWFDIVFRLRGFNLRVYPEGGSRWTDTWDNCTVWVDENDVVKDIEYKPHCPFSFSLDDMIVIEQPGVAVGHTKGLERADFQ
jgi:hypothetical protein